ncbi:MAG: BON domain-containing protein [Solirubrobacterales bacterium]|nr:BON domain-containing protein [Solirubrobacterales bacterium]
MRLGFIGVVGGAAAAAVYLLDARRRNRTKGAMAKAGSPARQAARAYDDVTSQHRVQSALFANPELHALKGHVSVNVADGIAELRGQVERPEQIEALGAAAKAVPGVRAVHNLLHTPGTAAGHSPPSTPDEVRERAEHETGAG